MAPKSRSLRLRLLALFGIIYGLAFALLFITNVLNYHAGLSDVFGFWGLQMLGLGVLFIAPGYWASATLLRPLLRWLDGGGQADPELAGAARRAALSYPWQAVVFFALFGIFGSGIFHLTSTWHDFGGLRVTDPLWWPETYRIYLSEFSLAISLGVAYLAAARRVLRPFLLVLPPPPRRDVRRVSIRYRFLVTVTALSLTTGLPIVAGALFGTSRHQSLTGLDLSLLLLVGVVVSLVIALITGNDMAADLTLLTNELKTLASGRVWRHPLAMASDDELGDLALAFNDLRTRAEAADRALEAELDLARRVQTGLLPRASFARDGWRVSGLASPALSVGGDFYDILDLGDGRLGVAIGDASGRGLPAALMMAAVVGFVRSEAPQVSSPGRLLGKVNDMLCSTLPSGAFVTMAYAVIDLRRGHCLVSSAGHVDPLLSTAEGVDYISFEALPLGVESGRTYADRELTLPHAAKLILYSDGVVEARNKAGRPFGFSRLVLATRELGPAAGGQELVAAICQRVREHLAGQEIDDDLAVVVVETPAEGADGPGPTAGGRQRYANG